jgi:hypothetical protein
MKLVESFYLKKITTITMLSKDYILGLVEGEGCFNIGIGLYKVKSRQNVGKTFIKQPYIFSVKPSFHIAMANKDRAVLEAVKATIGLGKIYIQTRSKKSSKKSDIGHYYVNGIENCLKLADFFKDLEFQTTKGEDFMLWNNCLKMLQKGLHKTKEGIIEIARLRDCMNNTTQATKHSPEELGKIFEEKLKERRNKWLKLIHNKYSAIDPKTKRNWKKLLQENLDSYSKEILQQTISGPKQVILATSSTNY